MIHPNKKIWLKPPTPAEIKERIEKEGVACAQFERFHGMFRNCITDCIAGRKKMPVKFWHLFMEPPTPAFIPTKRLVKKKEDKPMVVKTENRILAALLTQ